MSDLKKITSNEVLVPMRGKLTELYITPEILEEWKVTCVFGTGINTEDLDEYSLAAKKEIWGLDSEATPTDPTQEDVNA